MSSDGVLKTLFLPLESGALARGDLGDAPVFINARSHAALKDIKPVCMQAFKPYADALAGYDVVADIDAVQSASSVWMLLPKNQKEAVGLIAKAALLLGGQGVLICAADNKAGGARLSKTLKALGFQDFTIDSKNKARVAVIDMEQKAMLDRAALIEAAHILKPQKITDGRFWSVPGIYGWDKIDKGSALLVEALPECLSGHVADFGCGYGYLSDAIMHKPNVERLCCIDADARALAMCRENLEGFEGVDFQWMDLSVSEFSKAFDAIVMNPPFHEGRAADVGLGQDFIRHAAAALKPKGRLWMVANAHLPYEEILKSSFSTVEKILEKQGFKVYRADI